MWLLVVYLFLPGGTVQIERYENLNAFSECMDLGVKQSEEIWNKHDKKGAASFQCIDKSYVP